MQKQFYEICRLAVGLFTSGNLNQVILKFYKLLNFEFILNFNEFLFIIFFYYAAIIIIDHIL
jgi:hypothetical protein